MNFHLDSSDKREGLPEVGGAKPCGRVDCPHPNFTVGFGLAGGGFGVYEYCEPCGRVVSKTLMGDDE